jgi:HAD superfamily hydrolase (TIGR01509 family)
MDNYRAVIFDMDGVIVDSEPLHERAFGEVFRELGYPGDSHGLSFADYYGRSDEAVWIDFIRLHRPQQGLAELLQRKRTRFLRLLHEERPVFDGLIHLLQELHPLYPLGLASGSGHAVIDGVLALEDLRRFFRVVVSASDVGKEKPAPDIFLRTAELLGVPPGRCCVIEDSVAGIQGAVAAGMTAIAITNSFPADRLAAAHHIVGDYGQIRGLLLGGAWNDLKSPP